MYCCARAVASVIPAARMVAAGAAASGSAFPESDDCGGWFDGCDGCDAWLQANVPTNRHATSIPTSLLMDHLSGASLVGIRSPDEKLPSAPSFRLTANRIS